MQGHTSNRMMKLNNISRLLIFLSASVMVITFFVPVWQILMWAPQYPEGLEMKIWLHTLTGDYKIISGLNHYIGMKHIEIDMFPEFEYMRYVVAGMIIIGILSVLINRRWMLVSYLAVILVAAVVGLADFYMWGYEYGHNLDPKAPIIVPGMAYQPPLLGTKQLLNFTAFSGPDVGGWVLLVSGLLAIASLVLDLRRGRKMDRSKENFAVAALSVIIIFFASACAPSPEPLAFGKDSCHACKMLLVDNRFGAELVTSKGKVFKFDDTSCMISFIRSGAVTPSDISYELVVDYGNLSSLIDVNEATLLHSPNIKSPMGGNVAAFSKAEDTDQFRDAWSPTLITWENLKKQGVIHR